MPRDYKHSKRSSGGSGLSGIAGFVAGLALGLGVAVGVYLFDRRPEAAARQVASAPMTRDEGTAPPNRCGGFEPFRRLARIFTDDGDDELRELIEEHGEELVRRLAEILAERGRRALRGLP